MEEWNKKKIEKWCEDNFIEGFDERLTQLLKGENAYLHLEPITSGGVGEDDTGILRIEIELRG